MKRVITCLLIALVLTGCLSATNVKPLPPGARPCSYDWDCSSTEYCGFRGVDTPAQCLPGGTGGWRR